MAPATDVRFQFQHSTIADIKQIHLLIRNGFWESETCFALYPNRTHKLDLSGLDLAFPRFPNGEAEVLQEYTVQQFFPAGKKSGSLNTPNFKHTIPARLCAICIHFESWIAEGSKILRVPHFYLGKWRHVKRRYSCGLCLLVSLVVTLNSGNLDSCHLDSAMVMLRTRSDMPGHHQRPITHVDVILARRDPFGWAPAERLRLNHAFQFSQNDAGATSPPWIMCKGRRISNEIDLSLLNSWVETCSKTHGTRCSQHILPLHNIYPKNMSLLDLQTLQIRTASEGCTYIALSYVWGKVKPPKPCNVFHDGQLVRSYLSLIHELPKTIQDAILLTRGLGVRFLWIDALCIDQEHDDERMEQIRQMDRIYSSAQLTVVAAYGRDGNAGLPGLTPNSRLVLQSELSMSSIKLIMSLGNQRNISANTTITEGSWWNQRGWTYQEMQLSRRSLIFTSYQVYFSCRSCIFREDSINPESHHQSLHPVEDYGKNNPRMVERNLVSLGPYATVLDQYSIRRLTKDIDYLFACDAVLKSLGALLQSPMFWGLPTRFFDAALWWDMDFGEEAIQGRGHCRSFHFPSWSWASTLGKISHQCRSLCIEKTCCFYKECSNGTLEHIDTSGTRKVYKVEGGLHEEVKELWDPKSYKRIPTIRPYACGSHDDLTYTGFIVFWTIVTTLRLRVRKDKAATYIRGLVHCDIWKPGAIESKLGSCFLLNNGYLHHDVESTGEFALLGKLGSNVGLLLINSVDGRAYRLGFTKIDLGKWETLPKAWKLLRLG